MKKSSSLKTLGLGVLFIIFFLSNVVLAGSFSKDNIGTTSAQFLKIGCGARAIAMGEAFTAVADDVSAIYWNPAGLNNINNVEISAMHSIWLEEINYDFLAYAQPLLGGTIAGSLNYLSMTKMDKMDELGNADGTFSPYDAAANIAYARKIGFIVSGINLKFIQQKIDEETGTAYAVDAGISVKNVIKNLDMGIAVQNLGTEVKFIEEKYALPLNIKLGLKYQLMTDLMVTTEACMPIDNDLNFHVGCEYILKTIKSLPIAWRVGYKTNTVSDLDAMSGLSGGLGFNMQGINIDYAWVPYGDLGDTHRISLGLKMGKNSNAVKKQDKQPKDKKVNLMKKHYNKAVKYYKKGKYDKAMKEIEAVLKLDPNHSQSKQLSIEIQKKLTKSSRIKISKK